VDKRIFFLVLVLLLTSCAGSKFIKVEDVEAQQDVKLFLSDGKVHEGLVLERRVDKILFVDAADQSVKEISISDVRRIEKSTNYYDYNGYPISEAEIKKYRKNKNTWGYAIGGGFIGGAVGLAVGLPIWLANDNPPPLFATGLGFVAGSILYASKGVNKDRRIAVIQVREFRKTERELEAQRKIEEERLKQLKAEKERLKKQLEDKRKRESK
jgi:hypothetical protein